MRPALALADMSEKTWQQQVIALARTLGYRVYHTLRSKGSQPGYPDLTLVRPETGRLIFLELKSETGATTVPQRDWIQDLHRCGQCEVYVVRPRHLQALASVLGTRTSPEWEFARGELLLELDQHVREAA